MGSGWRGWGYGGASQILGKGEPIQEVAGVSATVAGAAVAVLSVAAAKSPTPGRVAQQTITGLETGPGRVSVALSQEPPPASRLVQSRMLRSGRLVRGTKGLAGQRPGCSLLPLETRFENCPVRGRAEYPGRWATAAKVGGEKGGQRRASLGHASRL